VSACACSNAPRPLPTVEATSEPTVIGEPLPGYVHLVGEPPQAKIPIRFRYRDPDFPLNLSTVYFDFAAGQTILIVAPSTAGVSALQMNDTPCAGLWPIRSQVETDVVLHLDGGACRVEVIGSHPFGTVHTDPQTEPQVDGH
jgi:hypothetical protein